MLLLIDVAKLFWREGTFERVMLDSPLVDVCATGPLYSACGVGTSGWSGKAQGKPGVGAEAVGSGIPDTLLGLGVMTGARRGGCWAREPLRVGDRGEVPLGRTSGFAMPRCCCRFETSETRDGFWLS